MSSSEKVPILQGTCRRCIFIILRAGGMLYVDVRLAIDLSLAKLAKRIYDSERAAASRFSVLQATKSWAGPGNEARFCSNFMLCLFLPLFRLRATIDTLTFTLLMQLGMALGIAQQNFFFYMVRSPHIYHRLWGWGSLYLCRFGDGVPKSI